MTPPYDSTGRYVRTPFDIADATNSPGVLLCKAPSAEGAAALAALLNAAWGVLEVDEHDLPAALAVLMDAFYELRPGPEPPGETETTP